MTGVCLIAHARALCRAPKVAWPCALGRVACTRGYDAACYPKSLVMHPRRSVAHQRLSDRSRWAMSCARQECRRLAHGLVATRRRALLSRHRTLCRDMEILPMRKTLLRHKKALVATQNTLAQPQILSRHMAKKKLYRDRENLCHDPICLAYLQPCCNVKDPFAT